MPDTNPATIDDVRELAARLRAFNRALSERWEALFNAARYEEAKVINTVIERVSVLSIQVNRTLIEMIDADLAATAATLDEINAALEKVAEDTKDDIADAAEVAGVLDQVAALIGWIDDQ